MPNVNAPESSPQHSPGEELVLDSAGLGEISITAFLAGQIEVPDDFDTMGSKEIEEMFGAGE